MLCIADGIGSAGRVPTIMAFESIGVTLMVRPAAVTRCATQVKMSLDCRLWADHTGPSQTMTRLHASLQGTIGIFPSLWPRVALIVPMVIIRSAANNCCYALQKVTLSGGFPPPFSLGPYVRFESLHIKFFKGVGPSPLLRSPA